MRRCQSALSRPKEEDNDGNCQGRRTLELRKDPDKSDEFNHPLMRQVRAPAPRALAGGA